MIPKGQTYCARIIGRKRTTKKKLKLYSKVSKKHPFNTNETVMEELRNKKDVRHIEKNSKIEVLSNP